MKKLIILLFLFLVISCSDNGLYKHQQRINIKHYNHK